MNTAVVIPVYDRLDILRRCVASLKSNNADFDLLVFPDLVKGQELSSIKSIVSEFFPRAKCFNPPPERLYGCRNIAKSVIESYNMGYKRIVRLDSDIVVSRNFLKVLESFSVWINGSATSSIECSLSKSEKEKWAGEFHSGQLSGSNFSISRENLEKIIPLIKEYDANFLVGGPYKRNNESAKTFLSNLANNSVPTKNSEASIKAFSNKIGGTGFDSFFSCALCYAGIERGTLVVNRAIHPSSKGENTTVKFYNDHYKNSVLDEIEGDSNRNSFHLI